MISRIILTEVNVRCRSQKLRKIILTEVWIILDIMRKRNQIIFLLYIQNSGRWKKRFAVNSRSMIFFWTASSNNSLYSAEMMSRLPDIEN